MMIWVSKQPTASVFRRAIDISNGPTASVCNSEVTSISHFGTAVYYRSGWGTRLQTGRSRVRFPMVSLEFFSNIVLPVALWPWGRLSLWQKWVPGVFHGGKGGRCVGLTNLPPSCAVVVKSGNLNFLEPSGPLKACNGTALPYIG